MKILKFLNHSSYLLENNDTILLQDPWFEGTAFNKGWALLYGGISNLEVINYLKDSRKRIFIWISHEHSDHLSIPFINELEKQHLKVNFFYQKTIDKRVIKYLIKKNFYVTEAKDGKRYPIGKDFTLTTLSHLGGDSLNYVDIEGIGILNINDCVIKTNTDAIKVLKRIPFSIDNIDILFTQFGYANWIGNEKEKQLRLDSALEKIDRILPQNKIFRPKSIIPFASFVYFSKKENYYLNLEQNGIAEVRNSKKLKNCQEKIHFMKPNQEIDLDQDFKTALKMNSAHAEEFWENKIHDLINYKLKTYKVKSKEINNIKTAAEEYFRKINTEAVFMPALFELFGIFGTKSLRVFIYDLHTAVSLSYLTGFRIIKYDKSEIFDLKIQSNELWYTLNKEFGWNTLFISGVFKINSSAINKLHSFFNWQSQIKNGFSYKNPKHTLLVISNFLYRKIKFQFS